jgi:hypothetical protein
MREKNEDDRKETGRKGRNEKEWKKKGRRTKRKRNWYLGKRVYGVQNRLILEAIILEVEISPPILKIECESYSIIMMGSRTRCGESKKRRRRGEWGERRRERRRDFPK